jgi:hypothetical protein
MAVGHSERDLGDALRGTIVPRAALCGAVTSCIYFMALPGS